MTKERKLAIQMWKDIRGMLYASDGQLPESIPCYKDMFCYDHGLRWEYNCWCCQYIPECSKCPLGNCKPGSDYSNVKNGNLSKDVRIEACNNIIRALGGEA